MASRAKLYRCPSTTGQATLNRPTTTSYTKYIGPDTKVGLRLTAEERRLILDLVYLDEQYEAIVRATPVGKPISLTLDQWDDFSCSIAAKANHTEDEQLQWKLDAIFAVIEKILNVYTDWSPRR